MVLSLTIYCFCSSFGRGNPWVRYYLGRGEGCALQNDGRGSTLGCDGDMVGYISMVQTRTHSLISQLNPFLHTHKKYFRRTVTKWLLHFCISNETTLSQNFEGTLFSMWCCFLLHVNRFAYGLSRLQACTRVRLGSWSEETALVVGPSSWFWSGTYYSSDHLPKPVFSVSFPEKAAVQGQWDPCLAFKSQRTDHIIV